MPQQSSLAVKAGIVIIAGIILMIGFSLRSTGKGWFYKGYEIMAEFDTAKGLETGSQVSLAGVPIGQVSRLELMPAEGKVRVWLSIDAGNQIPNDAVGSIRLKTLLGNYHLYITHGTPQAPVLAAGDQLKTEDYKDLTDTLASLGNIGGGAGDAFSSIQQSSEKLFNQLGEVVEENRQNLLTTTDAFAQAAPKFNRLLDSLTTVSLNLEQGKGTIGRLVSDDELYLQIEQIVNNLDAFSANLNASQGTVGRLVNDQKLAGDVAQTFANARDISDRLRGVVERNEANLDRTLEAAGTALPKLDQGMDHFVSIGRKIDEGEGTLGKLINDPEIYNSVRDAVNQIRRTFEEGEEQSVMRTFLGVFFGSVI